MTVRLRRVVVVGASLAGHQVATRLRGLGYDGELTVFGAETHQPYDRYPLSKTFLSGDLDEAGLAIEPGKLDIEPGQLDIEWRLGQWVTGLDLPEQVHHRRPRSASTVRRPWWWRLVPGRGCPPACALALTVSSSCGHSRTARRCGRLSRRLRAGWWSSGEG